MSRVVAYGHSRRLSDAESRSSQIERETSAPMLARELLKIYLLGTKLWLVTDQRPQVSIFGKPTTKPTPRLKRRSLELAACDSDSRLLQTR